MTIFDGLRKRKKIPSPWDKYYSQDDINIKIPNTSLYKQIVDTKNKYPEYIAYKYFGKKVSYKSFIKQIDNAAIAFQRLGVKKGEIVTICLPNIPETIISFYALNKLGVICNMVHPLSAEEEIKETLIFTKSRYLIMLDSFYNKIEKSIYYTLVEKVIFASPSNSLKLLMKMGYKVMNFHKYKKYPKNDMFISWNRFILQAFFDSDSIVDDNNKNTSAAILHSGGTSGKPKHVVIQNRAFMLNALQEKKVGKNIMPGDVFLAILPNFHGFGLSVCIHTPLTLGCTTVLVPQFDANKFDVLFNKEKPSVILGVPTLFEALISNNNVKDLDLSFLKYVISGGDKLSAKLEKRINDYLKEHNCKEKITQGYGLTEALAAVCLCLNDNYKSGSIGIPLPGNYVKIIDPATRKTKAFNEDGEIVINSRALMLEYLHNESDTNEALQIHDDGHVWLHTGDLGYMDEDGFIFYKGRSKRMIISSGYNVYPSYIEEVIENHPAVLQCTVVGVPHEYKQEVPKAFIVLRDGFQGLFVKQEIKDYCKKNLAKYMIPQDFVYRKKLPKTKLGKIDFKKLEGDFDKDDI